MKENSEEAKHKASSMYLLSLVSVRITLISAHFTRYIFLVHMSLEVCVNVLLLSAASVTSYSM